MTISLFSNIGSSLLFKSPISRFAAATAIIGLAVFTISKINERLKNASGSGVLGVNPGLIQDKSVELKKKISELESTVARQASEIESLRNTNKTFSSLEEANKNLSKKLDECQKENEVHKLSQAKLKEDLTFDAQYRKHLVGRETKKLEDCQVENNELKKIIAQLKQENRKLQLQNSELTGGLKVSAALLRTCLKSP